MICELAPTATVTDVGVTRIPDTGVKTVTVLAPCIEPTTVIAFIATVPFATPVTTPVLELTVAIAVFADDHTTALFDVFDGKTVAASVVFLPTFTLTDAGETVTDVATIGTASVTVTAAVAMNPPLTVVTVIVAEPTATAVTTPVVAFTVAIVILLDEYETPLFVAFVGDTVAVREYVLPMLIEKDAVFKATPVT